MAPEPRWLSDDEQRAWRAFFFAGQLLDGALDRQLQADAGMPHAYYGILVALLEAGDDGVRMSELARLLRFSPSRLAHAMSSLERSGWVERRSCPDDRRGQVATITAVGAAAQRAAAPGHVAEVRARVFDRLTPGQIRDLELICGTIVAGFDD